MTPADSVSLQLACHLLHLDLPVGSVMGVLAIGSEFESSVEISEMSRNWRRGTDVLLENIIHLARRPSSKH